MSHSNRQRVSSKSDNLIDWVLDSLHNVHVSAGRNGQELRADCPFCEEEIGTEDTKNHLYINKYKPVYHCFRCEKVGDWFGLVMAVEGCTYAEAVAILAGAFDISDYGSVSNWLKHGVKRQEQPLSEPEPEEELPFEVLKPAGNFLHSSAVNYLRHRKIPKKLLYGGLFAVVPGTMRVYVFASDTYWQGRAMLKSVLPKYVNPKKPKDGTLGLWDSPLLDVPEGPLWVVEGLFSGIALYKRGKAVGALLGKSANDLQLSKLVAISKERGLVVCLDADAGDEAWELTAKLQERGVENLELAVLEQGDPESNPDGMMVLQATWRNKIMHKLR